jgi:predicted nucleotide-binding protein
MEGAATAAQPNPRQDRQLQTGARPARVFVASSSASLSVVDVLVRHLQGPGDGWGSGLDVVSWTKVFELSLTNIENLEAEVARADFAILLLTADDLRAKDGTGGLHPIPRDNVVFELGLFMGGLGRRRCFLVEEAGVDIRLPSDLAGIGTARFNRRTGSEPSNGQSRLPLAEALYPACKVIADAMARLGARELGAAAAQMQTHQATRAFCQRVAGCWWSLRDWDPGSRGALEISGSADDGSLRVSGRAYRADGALVARWHSDACAANAALGMVYFHFTGFTPASRDQAFQRLDGMTRYHFETDGQRCVLGRGEFIDQVRDSDERLRARSLELRRMDDGEATVFRSAEDAAIGRLVAQRLAVG